MRGWCGLRGLMGCGLDNDRELVCSEGGSGRQMQTMISMPTLGRRVKGCEGKRNGEPHLLLQGRGGFRSQVLRHLRRCGLERHRERQDHPDEKGTIMRASVYWPRKWRPSHGERIDPKKSSGRVASGPSVVSPKYARTPDRSSLTFLPSFCRRSTGSETRAANVCMTGTNRSLGRLDVELRVVSISDVTLLRPLAMLEIDWLTERTETKRQQKMRVCQL